MNFASFDIRVGATGEEPINKKTVKVHSDIVRLVFPSDQCWERVGMKTSIPFGYKKYAHQTKKIKEAILKEINTDSNNKIDLCLLDFTSAPFLLVSDGLLTGISLFVNNLATKKICTNFIILFPQFPIEEHFLNDLLNHYFNEQSTSNIIFLDKLGNYKNYSNLSIEDKIDAYTKIMKSIEKDPENIVSQKCIRRLGHFKSSSNDNENCRYYSYYFFDLVKEFKTIFENWWQEYEIDYPTIVYDLRNNESFKKAVQSFKVNNKSITCLPITDIIKEKTDVLDELLDKKKCVLILDVVDTGKSLREYIQVLDNLGVEVCKNIIVAINKNGRKQTTIEGYNVFGVISKTKEGKRKCRQCQLDLDYMDDSFETDEKIRTFDFHHMAYDSKWEAEPQEETPKYRDRIVVVPNFSKMLTKYGDWIAFKLIKMLEMQNPPGDLVIIHPKEADSLFLSDLLQKVWNCRLPKIEIPRPAIVKAVDSNYKWENIVNIDKSKMWVESLKTTNQKTALILDVFNASNGTCNALIELTRYFNMNICGYACIANFSPSLYNEDERDISKTALYDLYTIVN